MTTPTKTQPNYTTQDAATYKAAIDGVTAVYDRIAGAFAPHEMNVGSPAPDLAVRIDAGFVFTVTNVLEVAAQTVTGFTIPSAGQQRIDRIVINRNTGVATRVAGIAVTGSPSATPPLITSGNDPCCRILITSSDTVITNSMITDERISLQPKLKVGSFTRDISLTDGNIAYTGVGFKPRSISVAVAKSGGGNGAVAFADDTSQGGLSLLSGGFYLTSGNLFVYYVDASNYSVATLISMDADGFTLNWAKGLSPTGTIQAYYEAKA